MIEMNQNWTQVYIRILHEHLEAFSFTFSEAHFKVRLQVKKY